MPLPTEILYHVDGSCEYCLEVEVPRRSVVWARTAMSRRLVYANPSHAPFTFETYFVGEPGTSFMIEPLRR